MRERLMQFHQYCTNNPRMIYFGGVFDTLLTIGIIYAIVRLMR